MISVFIAVAALFASSVLALEENPCLELPPPGNGFVNDLRHCSQYFSCMSWLPFEMTCPYNFYFDPVRQVCDSPTNVQCSICRASGVHGVGDSSSCTRWTLCVNGIAIPMDCAPGTAFDAALETCNLAENVMCAADTCLNLAGGTGTAASPDSCFDFHFCHEGRKVQRGTCAPGLAFDSVSNRCAREDDVECFPGTTLRLRRAFGISQPVAHAF